MKIFEYFSINVKIICKRFIILILLSGQSNIKKI